MYNFLIEQTSVVRNSEIDIINEVDLGGGKHKINFRANLQEAENINKNKRYYSVPVCESIVNQLSPKAQGRSLLMEIDHPMFASPDVTQLKKRAAVVELNNCGALIRGLRLDGRNIVGEIETLSGFKGPDLANLITRDKVDVGFSLRALGAVEPLQDGTLRVKAPIMPITYDVVSNPSHTNSRVIEFIPEHASEFISEQAVIMEDIDFSILNEEQIRILEKQNLVGNFLDQLIDETFPNVVSKKIKFWI